MIAVNMTALARASSNCKRQTRPLVREGAPHRQTGNCLTVAKIWSCPSRGLTPRQTGPLTVGRTVTLTLTRGKRNTEQRSDNARIDKTTDVYFTTLFHCSAAAVSFRCFDMPRPVSVCLCLARGTYRQHPGTCVRVSRCVRCQQPIRSSPLTEIRITGCVSVITGPWL
jgi:hypothetical protein